MHLGVHVFVDGNNLMGSRPDGWWRDRAAAERRLVEQLASVAQDLGGRWTVVFDGVPPRDELTPPAHALSVEYAERRGPDAADDHIVGLLASLPNGADALVYTSDRRLRERASALAARVKGVSALLREIDGGGKHSREEPQ